MHIIESSMNQQLSPLSVGASPGFDNGGKDQGVCRNLALYCVLRSADLPARSSSHCRQRNTSGTYSKRHRQPLVVHAELDGVQKVCKARPLICTPLDADINSNLNRARRALCHTELQLHNPQRAFAFSYLTLPLNTAAATPDEGQGNQSSHHRDLAYQWLPLSQNSSPLLLRTSSALSRRLPSRKPM